MSIANRIKQKRTELGYSQAVLAKKAGIKQPSLNAIETGKAKNMRATTLNGLAHALNVTLQWLETGVDPALRDEAGIYLANTTPAVDLKPYQIPIISWVKAGMACEVVDLHEPGFADDWVTPTVNIKPHTYALRVHGDSMAPNFTEGMVLVVEPEMDYYPGDYVIAKNGDDEATFKKYVKDGSQEFLKPLNPQYPIIPMGTYKIIGVVREAVMRFR
jgi:SOS-response transcriptional repressor LexA